ncbi:quinolinate synthase NadA [Desulfolutivibrio sp.]|uniref:quinolinate synthase NadA n=1 Tax=Desulfolutivibrio sp. TaxID=2773296 RepID=UPI002F96101C
MNTTISSVIDRRRRRLGDRLAILAHHYQNDDIVRHADHVGDSLELSRKIADLSAEYIVFCGVFFMAETAAILAAPGQKVLIPDASASCVMSDMAPAGLVAAVSRNLRSTGRTVVPLTYVNSSARVKAVCGRLGGSVCTSANADTMLAWALGQGQGVLFLPDRMLGANTCDRLGIPPEKRRILDIRRHGALIDPQAAAAADVLLWPGRCVIHDKFTAERIRAVRLAHPGALVAVHPECPPETVAAADAAGSTSFLIRYVENAPKGATIFIGTEENLVLRLAQQHAGEKTILPLRTSRCSNMAKITEEKLAAQLADIESQQPVTVPDDVREPAKTAVTRMLDVCAKRMNP